MFQQSAPGSAILPKANCSLQFSTTGREYIWGIVFVHCNFQSASGTGGASDSTLLMPCPVAWRFSRMDVGCCCDRPALNVLRKEARMQLLWSQLVLLSCPVTFCCSHAMGEAHGDFLKSLTLVAMLYWTVIFRNAFEVFLSVSWASSCAAAKVTASAKSCSNSQAAHNCE